MLRGNSTPEASKSKRPSGRRPKMSISGLMRQLTDKPFEEEIKMKYQNIVNQLGFKRADQLALGDFVLVEESGQFTRESNAVIGGLVTSGFSGGNFRIVTSIQLDSAGKNVTISGGGTVTTNSNSWEMTLDADRDVFVLYVSDKNNWDGSSPMGLAN